MENRDKVLLAIGKFKDIVSYIKSLEPPELVCTAILYEGLFSRAENNFIFSPNKVSEKLLREIMDELSAISNYHFNSRQSLMHIEPFSKEHENSYSDCLFSFAMGVCGVIEEYIDDMPEGDSDES